MNIVEKAKEYAAKFHKDHTRLSGSPYIKHLEDTTNILRDNNIKDEAVLASSYLKHVMHFDVSKEKELKDLFGGEILNILKKYKFLSDNPIRQIAPTEVDSSFILQAYLTWIDDYRVLLIRLASKVEDTQTLIHLDRDSAIKIAQRALHIYSPIARMVSMRNFAIKLENEAFKFLYPEVYLKIEKKIQSLETLAGGFLDITIPTLKQLLNEYGIEIVSIKTRIKHIYGIFRKEQYYKYKGKSSGKNYSNIKDVLGLRIIVKTVEQCYQTEDLLKQLWEYLPEERIDYIQKPRASGYSAIHNVFKADKLTFETQILTQDMYDYNEFGPAKHSVYKLMDSERGSTKSERLKTYLNEYLNSLEQVSYYQPLINTTKVYAFTPRGDIVELPKGANLIDFAYSIHADIGNSAVGGLVNGKKAKLTDEINKGDKVEILTLNSKKYPSEDWIKLVKTAKARSLIKKALRKKSR